MGIQKKYFYCETKQNKNKKFSFYFNFKSSLRKLQRKVLAGKKENFGCYFDDN